MSSTKAMPKMPTRQPQQRQPQGRTKSKLSSDPVKPQPPRIVLNAVEGWGKTTFLAHAPKPAIIMTGDTGYLTLAGAGRVPNVARAETKTWRESLDLIREIGNDDSIETIGIDALGGLQQQAFEFVCANEYKGSWESFMAFMQGARNCASGEWIKLLSTLEQTGKIIVLLSHAKVVNFKNPVGEDFQRYSCDLAPEVWAATARWSDAVLFGNYLTITQQNKGQKAKGIGGQDRYLYTERKDALDAKNRYGLPKEIDLSETGPAEMWEVIHNLIKEGEIR